VREEDAGLCYTYGALTVDGAVCGYADSKDAETQCKKAIALFGGNLGLCSRVTDLAERDDCNSREIFAAQAFGPSLAHGLASERMREAFNATYGGLKFQNTKASLFEHGGGCLAQSVANGVALDCADDGCSGDSYTYALIACSGNESMGQALSFGKGSVFERMTLANLVADPELAERELPLMEGNKTAYLEGNETAAIYSIRASKGGAYSYHEFIFPTGRYFAYGSLLFEKGAISGMPDSQRFAAGFESLYNSMTGRVLANATKE